MGFFYEVNAMTIKEMELTVIAKGAPVSTSAGEVVMCAIAVGEIGLVRLYPLTVTKDVDIRVWSRVIVQARRSQKDNRHESWRVESCATIGKLESAQSKADLLDSCILKSGTEDPITYQNNKRSSIAIVKAGGLLGAGLVARDANDVHAIDHEEPWVMTQDSFPFKPYLFWTSTQGSEHKTHLVAQEVYLGMRNFNATPFRVFENMNIGDPDYVHWLVLGNLKDRRNVWVCPHIHRLKKTNIRTGLNLQMSDGQNDEWPYLHQEETNAKDVGPQMQFSFITESIA